MLLDTLKKVLAVYGPTGKEENVAECVKKLLEGKVDSVRSDAMGNLIVEKKGQAGGKNIMFSAHMDHIGLVVTDIEDEGFLRVTNVGGVSIGMSKTRHIFGTAKVGDRGQIVIPKEARELFGIRPGDTLLILGEENKGLIVSRPELLRNLADQIFDNKEKNND